MNNEARELLIERAVMNAPIAYSTFMQQLGFDSYNPGVLYSILDEISRFEHANGRPALTVMAKYLDKDDWGNGFYELTKELGYRRADENSNRVFAKRMQKECHEFWLNEKRKTFTKGHSHKIDFFTKDEIDFLRTWSGRAYDKNSEEHIAAKNYIMNSLGSKTVYWSNELVKRLDGYETFNWRMWSQKGWDDSSGTKKQVARFKHYTWARIYKRGDDNKD